MLGSCTTNTTTTLNPSDYQYMQKVLTTPLCTTEEAFKIALGDWCQTITTTELLPCDTLVAGTLPAELWKLEPMTCVNCGGRIDKSDLTCCFCGTHYR